MVTEAFYVEPLGTFWVVKCRRTIDGYLVSDYQIRGAFDNREDAMELANRLNGMVAA